MTVTTVVLVLSAVVVAVAGYRTGYRVGRSAPQPRPACPTLEVPQVRVLSSHAYDWETDE